MSEFIPLWENGPVFAQAEHFRLGTDSMLLADFVNMPSAKRGIDLGCASGALGVLLFDRMSALHLTGLEILPEAAKLAEENMERNGFSGRSRVINGDIRRHRELFTAGSFDMAVTNPPYFPVGSGMISPVEGRAGARGELNCTLEDICTAAAFLLRTGGAFFMVHKPERLSEAFCTMSAHRIEPKRMRLVCNTAQSAPNLVLIEGRRGGNPGLKIEAPLILRTADGAESEEYRRIYHR